MPDEIDMTVQTEGVKITTPQETPVVNADLLEYKLTCPCGHEMVVGVQPEEVRSFTPRRFATILASHFISMIASHLTTLRERMEAYDAIPVRQRVGLPTKSEIIVEYGDQVPCPLRTPDETKQEMVDASDAPHDPLSPEEIA